MRPGGREGVTNGGAEFNKGYQSALWAVLAVHYRPSTLTFNHRPLPMTPSMIDHHEAGRYNPNLSTPITLHV